MNEESPLISVIIPLYNARKYLRECLDSVKNQTFTNFECLCIDDGSQDETLSVIREYAAADHRFKVIEQANAGCSAARNTGLRHAKARYVSLLDQDDMYHPQALEVLWFLINKYQTDVASFKFVEVPDNFVLKNPPLVDIEKLTGNVSTTPFDDFFTRKKGGQVEVWTRLYDKQAIGDAEFPLGVQPAEDTIFTLKVFYNIKSIVTISDNFLFYRDSSTSVMNMGKTRRYVESHLKAARVLYDYFIKSGKLNGKKLSYMRFFITRLLYKTCISQVLRRIPDKKVRVQVLQLSQETIADYCREGIFVPAELVGRQKIVFWFFARHLYKLARLCA